MYNVVKTTMKKVGIMVRLIRLCTPSFPATVINPSANARARVPASVDKSPQLNTPRDNLGDITFESKDIFTPAQIAKPSKICLVLISFSLFASHSLTAASQTSRSIYTQHLCQNIKSHQMATASTI